MNRLPVNRSIANVKNPDRYIDAKPNGCSTLHECFEYTVKRIPNRQFLGTRNESKEGKPYEWKTFREIAIIREHFSKGIFKSFSPIRT